MNEPGLVGAIRFPNYTIWVHEEIWVYEERPKSMWFLSGTVYYKPNHALPPDDYLTIEQLVEHVIRLQSGGAMIEFKPSLTERYPKLVALLVAQELGE